MLKILIGQRAVFSINGVKKSACIHAKNEARFHLSLVAKIHSRPKSLKLLEEKGNAPKHLNGLEFLWTRPSKQGKKAKIKSGITTN
jgi:hypothetical protein